MHIIFHINDILNDSLQKFLMQVYEKSYSACTQLHADLFPFQYSNVCLPRQQASLYLDRFYFQNAYVHAFSSPKLIVLLRYLKEINTVNQLQLNYSTNIHIDTTIFEKFVCCNYKLNTLTDVPYQMTVGGAFVYVALKILNNARVYITWSVITRCI